MWKSPVARIRVELARIWPELARISGNLLVSRKI